MPGQFHHLPLGLVYVHDYGGAGSPVVAVHGLGGAHLNWQPVAAGLARYGRVLALDLPGFGYSPPQRSHGISIHARAVSELIEVQGAPAILLGNSLGGLVAMMVASRHPHLVAGLVLVAPATPPSFSDPSLDRAVQKRLLIQGLPFLGPEMIRRYWNSVSPARQMTDTLSIVCHHPERVSPSLLQQSLQLAAARRHQPWAIPALVGSGRSVGRLLADRRSLRRLVQHITAPTLVIKGGHDRVVAGSGLSWLKAQRPDWTHREMLDAGHCPQLEAPQEFLALVDDWLQEVGVTVTPAIAL